MTDRLLHVITAVICFLSGSLCLAAALESLLTSRPQNAALDVVAAIAMGIFGRCLMIDPKPHR